MRVSVRKEERYYFFTKTNDYQTVSFPKALMHSNVRRDYREVVFSQLLILTDYLEDV